MNSLPTVDTSAEARAEAFAALQGHPVIVPAVVHAFAIVFEELEALRAELEAKTPAPAAVDHAGLEALEAAAMTPPATVAAVAPLAGDTLAVDQVELEALRTELAATSSTAAGGVSGEHRARKAGVVLA